MITRKYCLYSLWTILPMVGVLLLANAAQGARMSTTQTESQKILEEKAAMEESAAKPIRKKMTSQEELPAMLPEDTTVVFSVHGIRIEGNTLIPTGRLLSNLPMVYNASSDKEISPTTLYDFRPLQMLTAESGTTIQVSARTIQGLTQYLLAKYQQKGYAGIYVYVPANAFEPGQALESGILPIRVLEAKVSDVTSSYFDVNNQASDRTYLSEELLRGWSPVQAGRTANRKKLDRYLKLLNLNPDRYVSGLVTKGDEPNSLSLTFNVYEADPWHYFVQVDNSGSKDTQWRPRIGLVNTNLLGFDDKLTVVYQAPPDSHLEDEYAIYGSYDFPLIGPELRMNVFAGHNEFNSVNGDGLSFLGQGNFYGGGLRYNLFQSGNWFFDLTGSISYEENHVTPSLFPEFLSRKLHWTIAGYGAELYHREDMWNFLAGFTRYFTLDAADPSQFGLARSGGADDNFSLIDMYARYSKYLDSNKVQRLSSSLRWIVTDDRLPPGRMTSFGGMYTVRGYHEYEIIADEGVLASVQYEYDLVRKQQAEEYQEQVSDENVRKPFLRKLAPLVFVDYGLAQIENAVFTEQADEELLSIGAGLIVELGEHITGTVYHGYPLIATEETRSGKGLVHAGFLFRW